MLHGTGIHKAFRFREKTTVRRSADRRETKRMFDEMMHFESQRLKRTWNLDIRELNSPAKITIGSAENVADFSMSKSCRFEWKKEDASTVPLFYRQHRHVHHSDLRLKHPLGTLDTNQLPAEILPRSSTLPSPVKLTHNRGELSMVKRVPAIKQKLFHESPTPKKAENSAPSNAVNVEKKISKVVPPSFHSKVTSSSSATSNTSNSESFSRKRKNFDNAEKPKIQLKITGT